MPMKKLILATSNPGKLAEIGEYLTDIDLELQLKPDDLEIEETGATFAENAYLKAAQIALTLGEWSIADDLGLEVTGLGNARDLLAAMVKMIRERIDRLVRELGDNQDRSARFVCVIAIARSRW
jgi:XTP/dITP diphosphohydrolase